MAQEVEEEGLGLLFQSATGETRPGVSRIKLRQKAAENRNERTQSILESNSFSISGSRSLWNLCLGPSLERETFAYFLQKPSFYFSVIRLRGFFD